MTRTADAIVIGAGVIGSAVAFELARSGKRVVVVDRLAGPGSGSTSASSSIIRYSYTTRDAILTSWEGAQMWFDWEAHLGCVDPDGIDRGGVHKRHHGLVLIDKARGGFPGSDSTKDAGAVHGSQFTVHGVNPWRLSIATDSGQRLKL